MKQTKTKKVLLFGSYAYGKASSYSDVDIVVVSKKFKTIAPEKRLDALYKITSDLYPDFHVFALTPEEFKNVSLLTTIGEAKTKGIAI